MSSSDEEDSMLEPPLILHQQQSDPVGDDQELEIATEDHAELVELAECTNSQKVRVDLKRPRENDQTTDDDEGDTCPICLEMWADAGQHRLCAMRCGHLFGRSCIEMWLQNKHNCPSCKKRGYKRELRNLYCSKVVALEESVVLDLKTRLQYAEKNESILQATIDTHVLKHDHLTAQVTTLRERLQFAQAHINSLQFNVAGSGIMRGHANRGFNSDTFFNRLVPLRSVQLSLEVGCRVMDHDPWLNEIVCSMKCTNALFGSYGLAKLDMTTFEITGNIPLHSAPIRDVRFQSAGGSSVLVTASMDKLARLIDTRTAGVAHTYAPATGMRSSPLWACCWGDPGAIAGSYTLFVGEQQGDIVELDTRRLKERVNTLKVEGDMSPVVSLQALPAAAGDCLPGGALLVCRLSSVRVFERAQGTFKLRTLRDSLQGPFMSMSIDKGDGGVQMGAAANGRHILISTRPNSAYAWTRHIYGEFKDAGEGDNLIFQPIHTFAGGSAASLLSRSCVTARCACAYMETKRSVGTWSLATGQMLPSHPVQNPILDVAMLGSDHLLALDDRRLEVFRME